jgi:hypothetical protein
MVTDRRTGTIRPIWDPFRSNNSQQTSKECRKASLFSEVPIPEKLQHYSLLVMLCLGTLALFSCHSRGAVPGSHIVPK